jgi:hypothetical protein
LYLYVAIDIHIPITLLIYNIVKAVFALDIASFAGKIRRRVIEMVSNKVLENQKIK